MSLSRGVKAFCDSQRESIASLKKEVVTLRESNRVQLVGLKTCFDEIVSSLTTLSDKITTVDVETRQKLSDADKKLVDIDDVVSKQSTKTKIVAENLDRVSKQFGIFREKTNRDSARFESELREVGDVSKALLESTTESLPRFEASLAEHWTCIEGLSANVNTIDETLSKQSFNFLEERDSSLGLGLTWREVYLCAITT